MSRREPIHLEGIGPCPFLPIPQQPLDSGATRRFGKDRGPQFYLAALNYAQSLWLQGFPAQALLLINRALGAAVNGCEAEVESWPLPYKAAAWVMVHRGEDQFIGNPRRHYQHLATRMVEPRKEQRRWRAWACWSLARRIFPNYPADEVQIAEEGVVEPNNAIISQRLEQLGIAGEVNLWKEALETVAEPASLSAEPRYG